MTYQYKIPLSGIIIRDGNYQDLSTYDKVGLVMHKMGKYRHLFPNGGETIKDFCLEEDGGQAAGIFVETNVKLLEGREQEFADSLQRQLDKYRTGLKTEGPAVLAGVKGQIPEKLYHITDAKNLDSIREKGLVPSRGNNNYEEKGDFVYLCSRDEIAVWTATLPDVGERTALLEVDTVGLTGIEPGRRFTDRDYPMSEFRTPDVIPAQAVHETDLASDRVFAGCIVSDMEGLLYQTQKQEFVSEIERGFGRLQSAGACTSTETAAILDEYHATSDAYTEYLFQTGYYKRFEAGVEAGKTYVDRTCGVTPVSFSAFHEEMASFSDSVRGMGIPDGTLSR